MYYNELVTLVVFILVFLINDLILHFKIYEDFKCRSVAYGHNQAI